jgi:hypothetical protein
VAHSKNRGAESSTARGGGDRWQGGLGRGARATRRGGKMAGGTSERRAHRRGGFHGGTARPEGNGGEARRPMVVVGNSWYRKVVGTRAIVGVASTEREGSR